MSRSSLSDQISDERGSNYERILTLFNPFPAMLSDELADGGCDVGEVEFAKEAGSRSHKADLGRRVARDHMPALIRRR
jgi:hypothetical protein